MKKKILTLVACLLTLAAMAQEDDTANKVANIDWKENPDEMTTIDDIKTERQSIANRIANESHYKKVWSNHGYFHIGWHTTATLTPTKWENYVQDFFEIPTGVSYNGGKAPKFSRELGFSIQAGKNIKLHKPIANILQFNLDFTGADVTANYYKAETDGGNGIYDSGPSDAPNQFKTYNEDGDEGNSYYYSHWNAKKIEASYGMNMGPSMTIAPFALLNGAKGLHYMKFNFYYHAGYCANIMLQMSDTKQDQQYIANPSSATKKSLSEKNPTQFILGHGFYQAVGGHFFWKRIGVGYEYRWGKLKYKNMTKTEDFGGKHIAYKFDTTIKRIYLTYRFGK